jgi:hypothetical protein
VRILLRNPCRSPRIQTERTPPQTEKDAAFATAQKLLDEYRTHFREGEILREYNDHLEKMIAAQEAAIGAAERRLQEASLTPADIVPLMARMLETLKQSIALDPPFLREEREARVAQLGDMIDDPEVVLGEISADSGRLGGSGQRWSMASRCRLKRFKKSGLRCPSDHSP